MFWDSWSTEIKLAAIFVVLWFGYMYWTKSSFGGSRSRMNRMTQLDENDPLKRERDYNNALGRHGFLVAGMLNSNAAS